MTTVPSPADMPATTEPDDDTKRPATEPTLDDGERTTPDEEPTGDERADDAGSPVKAARKEAAKYRRRARKAEAERDTIAGKYEALIRANIADRASRLHSTTAAALWDSGVTPDELLTEDGTVDDEKLADACKRARQRYGIHRGAESPGQLDNARVPVSWHDALLMR